MFLDTQAVKALLLSIEIENASTKKPRKYPFETPTAGNIYVYEILSRYLDKDAPCICIYTSKELGTTNTSINDSDYTIVAYPTECSREY